MSFRTVKVALDLWRVDCPKCGDGTLDTKEEGSVYKHIEDDIALLRLEGL